MSISRRSFISTTAAAGAASMFVLPNLSLASTFADKSMEFKVSANGRDIGEHLISFQNVGSQLHVKSSVDVAVKLAGFTAFYYKFLSHEIWENDSLVELKSKSDMNGKVNKLMAMTKGDKLLVQNSNERFIAPASTLPTSYWNPQVLTQNQLLNMQTGELTKVTAARVGVDKVKAVGRPMQASRYRVTGDLDMVLWYSDQGEWSAGSFQMQGHRVTFLRTA